MSNKRKIDSNKRISREKGITLIALVITIIVLIILAGVTITLVLKDNGILNSSKDAKEQYTIEAIREKLDVVKGSDYVDKIGNSTIDSYLLTLEKEKISPYIVTNTEKISNIAAVVEANNKYSYLIVINNNEIKIEYEGKIGEVDREQDNIEILLSGETEQESLPVELQIDVKKDGNSLTTGKLEINTEATNIGTDESAYSKEINADTKFTAEQIGNYYIHTLTIDKYGRKQETVKGPVEVKESYHVHTGSAKTGNGCYTKPVYHNHEKSKCEYRIVYCGGTNKVTYVGGGATHMKCDKCGNVSYREGEKAIDYEDGCSVIKEKYYTCNKSTSTIDSYTLGCNKTAQTVEGYKINY